MKKEIEYHEVRLSFLVRTREARRVTGKSKPSDVRSDLAGLVANAIGDNGTNCMDAEDLPISIDGKTIIGDER